jgi:hypothetical protein
MINCMYSLTCHGQPALNATHPRFAKGESSQSDKDQGRAFYCQLCFFTIMAFQAAALDWVLRDYGGYADGLLTFFPPVWTREGFCYIPYYVAFLFTVCPFLDAAETVRCLNSPSHPRSLLNQINANHLLFPRLDILLHAPNRRRT